MEYRNVVGTLRYLVHTWPDLAHSVSYVSRFIAEPREDHQAAVKLILRNIPSSVIIGVHYARGKAYELLFVAFSDSDLAGDEEDNRSTTGVLFYLGGSPITWQSQKRKSAALLSCEAEYMHGVLCSSMSSNLACRVAG